MPHGADHLAAHVTGSPPQDLPAEQGVLGGMLLSKDAIADVIDVVKGRDFYKPAHELIFDSVLDLYGRGEPADAVTVAAELTKRGELARIGGAPYLHTLMSSVPTAANAGYYAVIVRDRSIRRRAAQVATRLAHAVDVDATAPEDLGEVLSRFGGDLAAICEAPTSGSDAPHLAAVPEYPAGLIPGPLGELVRAARAAGLPPSLVGGAGLAALGTVTGLATVEVHGTWHESPAVWVPLIAPPGAGKSPAMTFAYRTLMNLDADARASYLDDLAKWRAGGERDRPRDPTRIQEDITTERVARWLGDGDGTGGIAPDELATWLRSLGRYRSGDGGGDRSRWLSNWALKQWPYTRITGDVNILIRRPVVSICGGLQPALAGLLGPEDDGFRARWLPHVAALDPSLRPQFGSHATPGWDEAVEELYGLRLPRAWTLGAPHGAALRVWEAARDRWKRAAATGGESAATSGALVKSDIQAARISLLIAESMAPGLGGPIPEDAMTAAVAVIDYTIGCWRALPGHRTLAITRREEVLHPAVQDLAAWLESHGGRATRRELLRAHVAGVRTQDALDAVLRLYEDVYPGSVRSERTGSRGPVAQTVHAPRRAAPPTAAGACSGGGPGEGSGGEITDQGVAERAVGTVAAGDDFSGDGFQATVSSPVGADDVAY